MKTCGLHLNGICTDPECGYHISKHQEGVPTTFLGMRDRTEFCYVV
jgi:hypothetical protein